MFNQATSTLLHGLSPGKRPTGKTVFPQQLDPNFSELRISDKESINNWFRRCVDQGLGGSENIGLCALEDHIAILAILQWNSEGLYYVNCQSVVALDGTLIDVYLEHDSPCLYHRLDLDLFKPGPLFKDYQPHIHSRQCGEPRFQFTCTTDNVVLEFIEFLYLNYAYDVWERWAKKVWSEEVGRTPLKDTFSAIAAAYASGKIVYLMTQYEQDIMRLRRVLGGHKRRNFPNMRISGRATSIDYNTVY